MNLHDQAREAVDRLLKEIEPVDQDNPEADHLANNYTEVNTND